jgi:hypothetical protein
MEAPDLRSDHLAKIRHQTTLMVVQPWSQESDQNRALLPSPTATEMEVAKKKKKLSASEPLVSLKPDQVRRGSVRTHHNQHTEGHACALSTGWEYFVVGGLTKANNTSIR